MKEEKRIQEIYKQRDIANRTMLYAWNRPEVIKQEYDRLRIIAQFISEVFGDELSNIKILDVGCGTGWFLRKMLEWGAKPENLMGTEFLEDRLEVAKKISADGIVWHIGDLSNVQSDSMDLVVANTVYSSILDERQRLNLANEMWRVLKPSGWIQVFDFRFNNPTNKNVKKITRKDLNTLWGSQNTKYKTVILAPPISRKLAKYEALSFLLSHFIPIIRSHFIYMAQK